MKAYLFAYSQACTQAQVQAFLNDTKAIKMWVAPFPYAAILVSDVGCAVSVYSGSQRHPS